MVPQRIVDYLKAEGIEFTRRPHPRAVTAQELAHSVHVSGYKVAKSVLVDADGKRYLAVLPATELLDTDRFAHALGAKNARLLNEDEFASLFPDCETGAEPPFGGLFGLPVVADESLLEDDTVVFRAGSHEESLEMKFEDFVELEHPRLASIGSSYPAARESWRPDETRYEG